MTTVNDSLKLNIEVLTEMLSAFFSCTHTYGYCMDLDCIRLTEASFGDRVADFLTEYVTPELEQGMIASLRSNPYEDLIRVDTGFVGIKLGGIAIRDGEGAVHGAMVVIGVAPETAEAYDFIRPVTEEEYASALTLAAIMLQQYLKEKNEGAILKVRLKEQEESSLELSDMLRKSELITGILKRMESDNDFPKVSEAILSDVGEYFGVSNGFLLRLSPDEQYVDMISEWAAPGAGDMLPDFIHAAREEVPFFSGRPYTVSSDAVLPDDFKAFFDRYDIRAGVFLPLFVSEKLGMYIGFVKRGEDMMWTQEDLVIFNDVKRIMQTILIKRVTKNSLASSYAVLDAILDNAGCGVCVKNDATGELLYTNELFGEMFSDKQDLEEFGRYIVSKRGSGKLEYTLLHSDKRCELSFVPIKWVDGRAVTLCTLYDVTTIYAYRQKLEEQAVTDTLTGLKNRKCFEGDLRECIRDTVRAAEQGYFVYMDLDDFKDINDSVGHTVGDELLTKIADALTLIARSGASVYRLGGDEFGMLIPHQIIDAKGLIESTYRRFTREFILQSGSFFCSATLAVVAFPKDGTRVDTLMQRADIALWSGKSAGKARIEYYNGGDDIRSIRRLSIEKEMAEAIDGGCEDFKVCFSPIPGDDPTTTRGAVATLMWESKSCGRVAPDEFIPLAEYLGYTQKLGRHILHTACERCRYWNDFGHPDFRVVIHMSMVQLLRSDISDMIKSELDSSGVDPSLVTIVFREWGTSYYKKRVKRSLDRISGLGVSPVTGTEPEDTAGETLSIEEFEERFIRSSDE